MNELIWKSEEEMQAELKKRLVDWKTGESKDGYIERAQGKFIYRGITYLIKVLRYYNHTNRFTTLGRDRISDCHVVVEYPEETKPIKDIIPYEYESDWLYHDTLHSWNDNQTTEQQIAVAHTMAQEDIDNLLDGAIGKKIEEGIRKLQEIKSNLDNQIGSLAKK